MSAIDADEQALRLKHGSIDRLHRRLAKALASFMSENIDADAYTLVAVLNTHSLALLKDTMRAMGVVEHPGWFEEWMSKAAGSIERDEHLLGGVQ